MFIYNVVDGKKSKIPRSLLLRRCENRPEDESRYRSRDDVTVPAV